MTISLTRTTCLCLSAISSSWRNRVRGASINSLTKSSIPALGDCFSCRELVLCSATTRQPLAKGWTAKCIDDPDVVMLPIEREAGLNDVGMVAWLVRLISPEFPTGRELVIICNDIITFQAGSFGTREDAMFFKASELAFLASSWRPIRARVSAWHSHSRASSRWARNFQDNLFRYVEDDCVRTDLLVR
jgi:hypothetical protein